MSDWVAKLQERLPDAHKAPTKGPEGEGWKTMADIIAESPFGNCKTREIIRKQIHAGEVEIHVGTGEDCSGRPNRKIWYRVRE